MVKGKKKVRGAATSLSLEKSRNNPFLGLISREKTFLAIVLTGFIATALFYQNFQVAMWLGFAFAAYSAIANDSIQTIGTFIGSNANQKWWILWLYIGIIFVATTAVSWVVFDGDVSWQRLSTATKDGNLAYPQPTSFYFLQVAAPLVLLIITRLKMPVSTTFLLLSSFSTSSEGITKMLGKSISGYLIAFVAAIFIWIFLNSFIRKYFFQRKARSWWIVAQWITSGSLWAIWIMQDAANIAVYLPRQLNFGEFLGFTLFIFFGLGVLFYLRGDRIQEIVSEKTKISDVRAATLVDLVYSLIMVYKLTVNTIPMSTTWVFLGLLGGREVAINFMRDKKGHKHTMKAVRIAFKDISYAFIGLIISVILAMGVNTGIREEIMSFFR